MPERAFDVVVIALGSDSPEAPGAALSRIVGLESEAAQRMLRNLPCVALPKLAYAEAESVVASLQLAGLEARLVPHGAPPADHPSLQPRATLPEIGPSLLRLRDGALSLLRVESGRAPAPETLRPVAVAPVASAIAMVDEPMPALRAVPNPAALCATELALGPSVRELLALQPDLSVPEPALSVPEPALSVPEASSLEPSRETVPATDVPTSGVPRWLSWSEAANDGKQVQAGAPVIYAPLAASAQAAPLPASPSSSAFGVIDGDELQPAVSSRSMAAEAGIAPPWSVEGSRVSLGFPEVFVPPAQAALPRAPDPAPHVPKVARAVPPPRSLEPARAPAPSVGVRASRTKLPGVPRIDLAPEVSTGGFTRRTVWLLGILWLSVALLLWSNGLLF